MSTRVQKTNVVFKRSSKGSKKIAPVNMRKEEHQFVIDGYLVDEVLSQIPASLTIIGASVYTVRREKSSKVVVPNVLRKYGVSHIWKQGSTTRTALIFDQISKQALKDKIAHVCRVQGSEYQGSSFKYIILSNGKGTVKFEFCTKEITPDETDLRKKLKVLGAVMGQEQVQSVISDLNASKYKCVIRQEAVKLIMCSKE